jgi:hypothetical protein
MKLRYVFIIPIVIVIVLFFTMNDKVNEKEANKMSYFDYLFVKSSDLNTLVSLSGFKNNVETDIVSLEDYQTIYYDFYLDNIFLYLEKKCSNCEIKYGLYQINLLNETYKLVLIKDLTLTEYNILRGDLKYYSNNLLIKSINNEYLLKYNLSNKEITHTNIKLNNNNFHVYKNKDLLLYHFDNNIYEYNFIYDKNNLLFENAKIMFLKDNKFVYGEWTSDINYKFLREYSYTNNKTRRIGIDKPNETYIDSLSSIYPDNTNYVYIASSNIINTMDRDGNVKAFLVLDFKPDAIMHMGSNLWIYKYPNQKYIYNLENKELKTYDYIVSNIKYRK